MTSLLLAAAIAVQDPAGVAWSPKAPYKDNDAVKYSVVMTLDDPSGQQVDVEMTVSNTISKKTEKGYEGSFGWTQLYVMGEEQPDEKFATTLKANGVLNTVASDYGPGMRRMLLPFYFTYPDKPVAVGGTWTYKDGSEDEVDAHKAVIEYKLIGQEELKSKKTHKVSVKISEEGPTPMKCDGHFWVGEDGRVLKYEMTVTGWSVPVAGQVFNAKITGELKS